MMTRIHNLYVYLLENLLSANYDVFVGSYSFYYLMKLIMLTTWLVFELHDTK